MPYVPLVGTNMTVPCSRELSTKSGGSWHIQQRITQTVTVAPTWSSRTAQRGKRVKHSWGWWSPPNDYQRIGNVRTVSGTRVTSGDGPDRTRSTRCSVEEGFPVWSGGVPSASAIIVSRHTDGKLDATGYPLLTANTRNRLITECIQKIGDRKANYGEAIAEGRKTLSHLARTSERVLLAILALRRGRFRDFARVLGIRGRGWLSRESSSRWLEYQYAWLPLLSDIYDTYGVLSKGIDRSSLTLRGVRNLTDSCEIAYPIHGPAGVTSVLKGRGEIRHSCVLHYRLTNSTSDAFYRLGLINPLEVAWAVVPFSFVVDWFLPVANVLEAYSALQGLTFVSGSISSKFEGTASGPYLTAVPFGYIIWPEESDMEVSMSGFSFKRQVVRTTPTPDLYIKSPFTSTHVISALALLRQLMR